MPQAIAFVIPRYGLDSHEGLEAVIRELAEALHRDGIPVEVLTTCTNDSTSWNNYYEPGHIMMNDILVRRFETDAVDQGTYRRIAEAAVDSSERPSYREQQLFLTNSINSSQLYAYLQQNCAQYRCCILGPYFAGTTYYAARIMNGKAVHIPFLGHDGIARFDVFREMLEEASGIVFMAPEEERLARQELGITNPQAIVLDSGALAIFLSGERTKAPLRTLRAAIDTFMMPRSLYQNLSQRGRRRALDFTNERYADKLHDLIDVALGDLQVTNIFAADAEKIAPLANITRPDYRVTSRIPVVGRLIAWLRVQLTSHLREPYLDPILARQEQFNRAIQVQVGRLAEFVWQQHMRSERLKLRQHQAQIAELQARVARLEVQLAERERVEDGILNVQQR